MSRRKNRAKNFRARLWRQRERQLLGSHGAASEVRHIDPAEHEPQPQPKTELPPPTQQAQIRTLLDSADTLLVADAKHRYGKRHGERVRGKIVKGLYRG